MVHISSCFKQLRVSLTKTILFLQAVLQEEPQPASPLIPVFHRGNSLPDQAPPPSNLAREPQPVAEHSDAELFETTEVLPLHPTYFSGAGSLQHTPSDSVLLEGAETAENQLTSAGSTGSINAAQLTASPSRTMNQQEGAAFLGSEVFKSIFSPPPAPPAPLSSSMETHPPSEQTGSTVQDVLEVKSEEATDPEDAGGQQTPAQEHITHQVEGLHEETSQAAAANCQCLSEVH